MLVNSAKYVLCRCKKLILDIKICNLHLQSEAHIETVPVQETKQKLLKIAVIGMPNAGKSTFINNLMDRKVCATSSKVHTTRKKSQAIFTEGDSQIIFLDTPGIVSHKDLKKFKLEDTFVKDCEKSLEQADLISVIHDVSDTWNRERLDIKIIRLLEIHSNTTSCLILNKVDTLKSKRKLLDVARLITENCIGGKPMNDNVKIKADNDLRGWPNFSEVFMISALTGVGSNDLKDYFVQKAKPTAWMFPCKTWSDQTPENIIVNAVKAKFLDFLPQELPYNAIPYIELYEVNDGIIRTVVLVKCQNERISKLIAGMSNGRLKQITESVQRDLQNTFQRYVRINIVLEAGKSDK